MSVGSKMEGTRDGMKAESTNMSPGKMSMVKQLDRPLNKLKEKLVEDKPDNKKNLVRDVLDKPLKSHTDGENSKAENPQEGKKQMDGPKGSDKETGEKTKKPYSELTEKEKKQIEKETGWSSKIIEHIKNMAQYEIYKKADLVEREINGRPCLIKRDLDMDYVSPKTIDDKHPNGISNKELMSQGRSPYDSKTGERIELHHMGQSYDSPFAELCENSEHGDGNHGVLHNTTIESWRQDPDLKKRYNNQDRPKHWIGRSEMG